MSSVKKYLKLISVCIVLAIVLAISFFSGGKDAEPPAELEQRIEYVEQKQTAAQEKIPTELPEEPQKNAEQEPKAQAPEEDAKAEDVSIAETEESKPEAEDPICTISISCETVLSNMDRLKPEKLVCIPENGVILAEKEVVFSDGETVFDILKRETQNAKIHMEFVETPAYQSAYVEGINNLYEFDCGELSGWVYRVNGENPGMGCSACVVKNGDKIEWLYTCNMGRDLKLQ